MGIEVDVGGQQTLSLQQAMELALQFHSDGDLAVAEGIFRNILEADPYQPVALHLLGVIVHQSGEIGSAVNLINRALAIAPEYPEAHNDLGRALQELGKLEEAADSYRTAVNIMPDFAEAYSNLGVALQKLHRLDEAAECYHRAVTIRPEVAEVHFNFGITLQKLKQLDEAVESYRRAISIKPDFAVAHNNLGMLLQKLNRLDEAADCFRITLAIEPDYPEVHYNLGKTLKSLNKMDAAINSFRRAIDLKPDYAEAHYDLGVALEKSHKITEAFNSYGKALAIKPDYADAHNNLGNVFKELGRLKEAAESYRRAVAVRPTFIEAQSNLLFSLSYSADHLPGELLDEACRFGTMVETAGDVRSRHANSRDPDRRLRIGMVSGDFRQHPVSYFLESILSELDAGKLELFAYATSTKEDGVTARIREHFPHWRCCAAWDNETLAAKIIEDRIDILVDLSGHTSNNRLAVFAMKPAPLQVTWLGYIATTGVGAMDYILCDQWVLPPEDEGHFVEKPWRLPDAYLCFTPPDLQVEVGALPALKNSYVTFGCFNNLTKINDAVIALWADILRSVSDSRLILMAKQLADTAVQGEVSSLFSSHGVSPERLILQGPSDRASYLAAYNQVDIAFDPFPYGGVTTSSEALWMGTPLLTKQGDRFVSRAGGSILRNAGLGDWIAGTSEDYVAKGIAFAADLPALSELRKGLRSQYLASSVCDAPRFARNLERAFTGMWSRWCKAS